ncbi:MAG: hypothetical protein LQ352_006472 [Teloschistes flavicans]|nr:MAG: hypothetical protein LQ352_006472 [Teloschistes flavicans]
MQLYTIITTLLLTIPFSCALDILFPLYLYPGDGASAWSDVFSTIESHSAVQFIVVVNPQSGPGTSSYPTDQNIISGVSKLNSYPNVHTVGYVLTGHGSRDTANVTADVDVYASWAGYSGANIAIKGIYFDEVSSETTQTNYDFYNVSAAHARTSIPSAQVVFNPGYRAPAQLFEFCDVMVEFEDTLANYRSQGILQQIPDGLKDQSAVQILNTVEATNIGNMMGEMKQLKAVYFGYDDQYKVWNKDLLQAMADAA